MRVAVDGLADLLGHEHCMLLLADEDGRRLFTIASRGYETEGIGAEVPVGEGMVGMAAAQCAPISVGNLRQMTKYAQTVRRSYEESGDHRARAARCPMPGLDGADSRMAVPAMALGQLVGVRHGRERALRRVHRRPTTSALQVVASLLASAVETDPGRGAGRPRPARPPARPAPRRRRRRARPPTSASSRSTAARSSTATT